MLSVHLQAFPRHVMAVSLILSITAAVGVGDEAGVAIRCRMLLYVLPSRLSVALTSMFLRVGFSTQRALSCRVWARCDGLVSARSRRGMVGKLIAVAGVGWRRWTRFVVRVEAVEVRYGKGFAYSRITGPSFYMKPYGKSAGNGCTIKALAPDLAKRRPGPQPSLGSWYKFIELPSEFDIVVASDFFD